jgi:hypothetical protein
MPDNGQAMRSRRFDASVTGDVEVAGLLNEVRSVQSAQAFFALLHGTSLQRAAVRSLRSGQCPKGCEDSTAELPIF